MSNKLFRAYLNGASFPEDYCQRFKESKTLGGYEIKTLRHSLKEAKNYEHYCIPEIPRAMMHDYSQEEIRLYFDVLDEFLDDCLGPLED